MKVVIDKVPRKHFDYLRLWRKRSQEYIMVNGAKCRSKRDGLEFNISKEDVSIPNICPVLGIAIKVNEGSGWHDDSPSLDRIDNCKGYVKGNIRVISNRANRLKCDATLEELELLLKDAYLLRHRM